MGEVDDDDIVEDPDRGVEFADVGRPFPARNDPVLHKQQRADLGLRLRIQFRTEVIADEELYPLGARIVQDDRSSPTALPLRSSGTVSLTQFITRTNVRQS